MFLRQRYRLQSENNGEDNEKEEEQEEFSILGHPICLKRQRDGQTLPLSKRFATEQGLESRRASVRAWGNQLLPMADPEIHEIMEKEKRRQFNGIELIASENFVCCTIIKTICRIQALLFSLNFGIASRVHNYSGCLSDSTSKPRCGSEFDSEKIAYDFYNAYGRKVGFSIGRESYSKNNKTGELTSRTFVCSKHVHNHPLVQEECTHMLPSQRKMTVSQAIEVNLAEESGITLKSSYELMGRQLDNEEHITNIFWADARMIIDYGQFGDVAMSGKASKTIFTDQEAAMAKALSVENEFLAEWNCMLDEYGVHDNNWLRSIFELRKKWAYIYVKQAWSAGMKSTQLSESFNASLKDYLKSDHNLPQFFMHFERMVNDKRYKELEAEYDSCYRLVNLKIPVKMLIQVRDIYTKPIFEEFHEQFVEAVELNITNCIEDNRDFVYTLTMYDAFGKDDNCKNHAIKVLRDIMNIKEIPDQYILKRWMKKARSECVQNMHGHKIQADPKLQQTSRYRSLCSIFTRISSRASESEKTYNLASEHASNLARLVEDILHLEINGNEHVKDQESEDTNIVMECTQNDSLMKAKGLKKKETCRGRRRFKSSLEIALAKKKKSSNSLQHCTSSKVPAPLLPMVTNLPSEPAINGPYLSGFPFQGCEMSNVRSETPQE
ncbi:hypothetical protein EZV62_004440 [Acer yangbiense]|uniref:Protein FAR1-RELATED SEQUENCE n=1 Tax=Acer yangbiense TaxID=1000413 RepID=A0A5C7IK31_9ROSI|nr:hypothetical protein EZV62_004440 [Acer yangbiense]